MIWKQRNECVFDNARPSIDALVDRIKNEAKCWAQAGAQGLRVVLPASWDLH
uniref:Uncharacterized protein n=1 Tax=Aegilops tauschii subsp. strangulata TaxID=200361 RepID=A0A453LNG6_AEGTS